MQTFRQDLMYAFQQIKRGKGVAAMVVVMIAVGIGANTAIFGLFTATLKQAPFRDMDRLVRIRMTPPDAVIPAIRKAVAEVDPATPVADVEMVEQDLADQIETPRFYMVALTIFGVVATLLAMFGIYAVIAHTVAQRTREIAIRRALGADARVVASLVLRQAIILTAIGMLFGIGASLLATRYLVSVLWGVTPTDASTFVDMVLLVAVVAVAASVVPMARALRLEPRTVLTEA